MKENRLDRCKKSVDIHQNFWLSNVLIKRFDHICRWQEKNQSLPSAQQYKQLGYRGLEKKKHPVQMTSFGVKVSEGKGMLPSFSGLRREWELWGITECLDIMYCHDWTIHTLRVTVCGPKTVPPYHTDRKVQQYFRNYVTDFWPAHSGPQVHI